MYWRTAQCKIRSERKLRSLLAEEEQAITSRKFSAYRHPLEMVNSFRYLGRVISAADEDWPKVVRNLAKVREVWNRMPRILSREGVAPQVFVFFIKARVQAVLIFGAETWVVTPCTGRILGGSRTRWIGI